MVEIKEFTAIRYNVDRIKKLKIPFELLVCPPYDVISEEMYRKLSRQKYNFINFELPKGVKKLGSLDYSEVKKKFLLWEKNKIFVKDDFPAFYVYEHIFSCPYSLGSKGETKQRKDEVKKFIRRGFFGLVKVDPEYRTILPHEQTKPKPIEDRLTLLSSLQVQTSPVFCLVEDDKKVLNKILEKICKNTTPAISFKEDNGDEHRVFMVVATDLVSQIKKFFSSKKLFIADGHHRYKTACAYLQKLQLVSDKIKNTQLLSNAEYFMSYICPLSDDGLLILPTHRAVAGEYIGKKVREYFDMIVWDGKTKIKLVVYHKGNFYTLKEKKKVKGEFLEIPSVVLNETVLKDIPKEQIFYHQQMEEVVKWADKYNGYAFLLEPLSKEKFKEVVNNKFLLPPKSTYFYPKVISGLVEYDLCGEQ